MKKWFGICSTDIILENEKEKQAYFRKSEISIKQFGYTFSKIHNIYKIISLEDTVFLEKGINNYIDNKLITMISGMYSRKLYKYELPAYIQEEYYYNNAELVPYQYLELEDNFFYTDRNNYELAYTKTNINNLMTNNYIGIISKRKNVGLFLKDKKVKCNFVISYTYSDIRIKIIVQGFYD